MNRTVSLLASLLTLSSISTLTLSASAQIIAVPNSLNFQGRLVTPSGNPVLDGTYSIRFSLHDALTGGTEKWNKTIESLAVKNGTFSVALGEFATDIFNSTLYLEIKIGSDAALTPRTPLVTVPYAFKANSIREGAITGASIANGTITLNKLHSTLLSSNVWLLGGNTLTGSPFLGSVNNLPVELRVNNRRALRYSYAENALTAGYQYRSVNVLSGSQINTIATQAVGATVAGGGLDFFTGTDYPNKVTADSGTVGGGAGNTSGLFSTVAGGNGNTASGADAAIGGGLSNIASGGGSSIGGGNANIASGVYSSIGGGNSNTASGFNASIVGGLYNIVSGYNATIGGGRGNSASGGQSLDDGCATVSGGKSNTATGNYSTVAGGVLNSASSDYSFAAGQRAQANHVGSFVWNDASDLSNFLASTGINQFLLHASGGVGINTNDPAGFTLNVNGTANFGGNITVNGTTYTSDARYKKDIADIVDPLDALLSLHGVSYQWDRAKFPDKNFGKGKQLGFLAQEVEHILPELVSTDDKGYKSVNYIGIIPFAVEAIKAQQNQIAVMRNQNNVLIRENATMQAKNVVLEAMLKALAARVNALETGQRK